MIIRIFCTLFSTLILMPLAKAAPPTHEEIRKQLDEAIMLMREGKEVPDLLEKQCLESFAAYSDNIFEKHAVDDNTLFPEPDRTEFYLNCVRSGLVIPRIHGGWVQRSSLRHVVYDNLISQVESSIANKDEKLDPYRIYGYFQPAFDRRDTKRAIEAYELLLVHDSFLANTAIISSYQGLLAASWVVTYYHTNKQEEKAAKAAKHLEEALFPGGGKKMKPEDYKGIPKQGTVVSMMPEEKVKGLEDDDIIVAVNGIDAPSLIHYCFLRDVERENPKIKFIIWRNDAFQEVEVHIQKTTRQDGRFFNFFPE